MKKLRTLRNKSTIRGRGASFFTTGDTSMFKDAKTLQTEFEDKKKQIEEGTCVSLVDFINSSDMRYFLIQNELDYVLFKTCIQTNNTELIT
jgi:hypothetical protein